VRLLYCRLSCICSKGLLTFHEFFVYQVISMQILSLPRRTPLTACPTGGVWVLGFFDGVHIGHRKLLAEASAMADSIADRTGQPCPVGVWTFHTLPKARELLTDPGERTARLGECGAGLLVMEAFSAVSALPGQVFFTEYLMAHLHPQALVCGFNFRFGRGGDSSAADLERWGRAAGVPVQIVAPCTAEGQPISSTRIRSLIRDGQMEDAARLLGQPYSIRGTVVHGRALGRKLGFPTANIPLPENKMIPASGVYACRVRFDTEERTGVCNIGSRPTVCKDPSDIQAETWISGYDGDLYGKNLEIVLLKRLRGEQKFPDLEALSAQMHKDARDAAVYFQSEGERQTAAFEKE